MTYYGGKEMAASFRTVRGNTLLIAEEIPEESYGFKASGESRTIGQTLAHIAVLRQLQCHIHQNKIDDLIKVNFPALVQGMAEEEAKPRTKAEILELLKHEGDTFAAYLESLPEPFLAESVAMPPGSEPTTKSRLEMLLSVKEHEMHHRGQLMLLQRMLGLTPHLTKQLQQRLAQSAAQAAPR